MQVWLPCSGPLERHGPSALAPHVEMGYRVGTPRAFFRSILCVFGTDHLVCVRVGRNYCALLLYGRVLKFNVQSNHRTGAGVPTAPCITIHVPLPPAIVYYFVACETQFSFCPAGADAATQANADAVLPFLLLLLLLLRPGWLAADDDAAAIACRYYQLRCTLRVL